MVDSQWNGEDEGGGYFECPPFDEQSGGEPRLNTTDLGTVGPATQIGGSSSSDQTMSGELATLHT